MEAATICVQNGSLDAAVYKRLDCTGQKFETCLQGIDDVIAKADPVCRSPVCAIVHPPDRSV